MRFGAAACMRPAAFNSTRIVNRMGKARASARLYLCSVMQRPISRGSAQGEWAPPCREERFRFWNAPRGESFNDDAKLRFPCPMDGHPA